MCHFQSIRIGSRVKDDKSIARVGRGDFISLEDTGVHVYTGSMERSSIDKFLRAEARLYAPFVYHETYKDTCASQVCAAFVACACAYVRAETCLNH
jgi:hypothetical protein